MYKNRILTRITALCTGILLLTAGMFSVLQTEAEAAPDLSQYISFESGNSVSADGALETPAPAETAAPSPVETTEEENQSTVDENLFRIGSMEEFLQFVENCKDATWSYNKTVSLDTDLDLTGRAFQPVAYFCGTFLGNRHSITGLSVTGSLERAGLFAVVTSDGCISELRVTGTVAPEGSSEPVAGGIAGENSGVIVNCIFEGSVESDYAAGGIAGINFSTARITDSKVSGTVSGALCAGGIAAENRGAVAACENYAVVSNKGAGLLGFLNASLLRGPICGTSSGTETDCRDYSARINSGSFFPVQLNRSVLIMTVCIILALNFLSAITALIIYSVRHDE